MELDEDEQFMTWVDFTSYESIGFITKKLKVATCSGFLYLTRKDKKAYLNLMLVDVYSNEEQFAHFKASYGFNIDSYPELKGYIYKGIVQPSRKLRQESNSRDFSLML